MESQLIKIALVIPSLRPGGAERVMSFLTSALPKSKFETLLIVTGLSNEVYYNVPANKVKYLNKRRVRGAIYPLYLELKRFNPDVVMGAISHVNIMLSLLSFFFPKTKFVGRETLIASKEAKLNNKSSSVFNSRKLMSWLLDIIVCQSNDMKYDLIKNYNFDEQKLVVINNPVTTNFKLKNKKPGNEKVKFITVGRLFKQKGHSRIINALNEVNYSYHYTIIGNGPLKDEIMSQIRMLNMEKNITHIDFTNEIDKYLSESDFYLQGSFVEGFPNALIESFAVGTPALVFEAPGGINEIMIPGTNGLIAKDEQDFLQKLHQLSKFQYDANIVRASVTERYSEEIIVQKYETLFQDLARSK